MPEKLDILTKRVITKLKERGCFVNCPNGEPFWNCYLNCYLETSDDNNMKFEMKFLASMTEKEMIEEGKIIAEDFSTDDDFQHFETIFVNPIPEKHTLNMFFFVKSKKG